MPIMSRIISYSTADKADVLAFLGAAEDLTADQRRHLGIMRERARQRQRDLDGQDIDLGLSIPDALEHLVAGHAGAQGEYVASAYHHALQLVIDCNASDPADLGVYSKPATFFGLVDDALRRLGVPPDLLLYDHLFSGPPAGMPFSSRIPWTDRTSARSRCPGPSRWRTPTARCWTGWTRTSGTRSAR
ncbi:hypothetical protein STENM223S_06978 [Streptomyces tendae]